MPKFLVRHTYPIWATDRYVVEATDEAAARTTFETADLEPSCDTELGDVVDINGHSLEVLKMVE